MSLYAVRAPIRPAVSTGTAARPGPTTLTLARAEARLLLRGATLWISVVLATALGVVGNWTRMQSWETFSQNAGSASMVLAGGLLLAGHLAAGRDHRYAMTETTRTLPTPAHRRIAALLVYLPVATAVGALAVGVQLLFLLPHLPAGFLSLPQLLVAVVTPPMGAAIGIAVGRWAPAAAVGPLTLVAAAVLVLTLPGLGNGDSYLGLWLSPVITGNIATPALSQPHGLHLAYLLALVAAIALMGRHRRVWAVVAALALAAAAGTVVGQTRQGSDDFSDVGTLSDRSTAMATLECQSHGQVRYCALPGFASWVPLWREAVDPVVAALPATSRDRLPTVRQVSESTGYDPVEAAAARDVLTWQRWGQRGAWARDSRAELAIAYARTAVGLPSEQIVVPMTPGAPAEDFRCSGQAQPRTVVALWLAAQSFPDGARRLAEHTIHLAPVNYGQPEIDAATTLLRLPRAQVTATLATNWRTITSGTVGGNALRPLGVTFPTAPKPGRATAAQTAPCP